MRFLAEKSRSGNKTYWKDETHAQGGEYLLGEGEHSNHDSTIEIRYKWQVS